MRVLGYLAACTVAGVAVGRAFGAFARASFHYPARLQDAPRAQQALLAALDVVEWPGLFALTLLCALGLWRLLRPAAWPPTRPAGRWTAGLTFAGLALAALQLVVPATHRPGRVLGAGAALLLAALGAGVVLRLWGEARAAGGPYRGRLWAQMPLALGHLVATSAAALSLGYRGESGLVHGIALLVGIGVFLCELALALALASASARYAAS